MSSIIVFSSGFMLGPNGSSIAPEYTVRRATQLRTLEPVATLDVRFEILEVVSVDVEYKLTLPGQDPHTVARQRSLFSLESGTAFDRSSAAYVNLKDKQRAALDEHIGKLIKYWRAQIKFEAAKELPAPLEMPQGDQNSFTVETSANEVLHDNSINIERRTKKLAEYLVECKILGDQKSPGVFSGAYELVDWFAANNIALTRDHEDAIYSGNIIERIITLNSVVEQTDTPKMNPADSDEE